MKKILSFIILIIFIALTNVWATEILVIDKPKIRLIISSGNSYSGVINVKNHSSETKDVKVYIEDWYYTGTGDGTKEFLAPGTLVSSASSWITFAPEQSHIPAFASVPVYYTVNVPLNAVGGHYAVLFFENLIGKASPEAEVGVDVAVRVGALFYVEPKGTVKRGFKLQDISLIQRDKMMDLVATFNNTGNVDITAGGIFNIIDGTGTVYARGRLNEVYTFPGDKAKINGTAPQPQLKKGNYDLVITLRLGEEALGVIEADLKVDSQGSLIVTTKS